MPADHPTKWVSHPSFGAIPIDAMLAPLIKLLWEQGIDTNQCCQEYQPGLACIEFPGTGEVMQFLFVAQEDYRVELERWDDGVFAEKGEPEHTIVVRLLVFFPTLDIPKVISRFEKAALAETEL